MEDLINQIINNCDQKEEKFLGDSKTLYYVKVCKTCSTLINYIETAEE